MVTKKSKNTKVLVVDNSHSTKPDDSIVNAIIDYAKQFDGVRYKYGGTTKHGMDCSGLVTTAFKSEHILLPRSTEDLVNTGNWIDLEDVQKGDLLFFATKKNKPKRLADIGSRVLRALAS